MARNAIRHLKGTLKTGLHGNLVFWQRLGLNVTPAHFYSSIPNVAELRRRTDWRAPRSMVDVAGAAIEEQAEFLRSLATDEIAAALRDRDVHAEAVRENRVDGGYGEVEADVLYALVRQRRPERVVQIGSGVSTAVIAAAAADAGYRPRIRCIDPFPTDYLVEQDGRGAIELLRAPAQEVELDQLTDLGEGDLFFVDSTHAVKVGSEVNRIVLEVLPRLAPGVLVHFHDIYFPYDHPRQVLSGDLFFPTESVLLHAFLVGNRSFRIRASLSMLHYRAPEAISALSARYDPQGNQDGCTAEGGRHFPSATFLEVIAPGPG